jgi:aminopeptidase N
VLTLRARQFREDAGPLAHPVRPEEYIEINNFYTATVYEKGAEVIGMLKRIVGDDAYARALDLYFDRHDGQACTIEDWLKVFEDATGRDLSQFKLWYSQAGTPTVEYIEEWDGETVTLTLTQSLRPTPGQPDKAPMHIPLAIGALHADGREAAPTTVVELKEKTAKVTLPVTPANTPPILSVNREFSAPVLVRRKEPLSTEAQLTLLAHDTDPFNRWEAGRALAKAELTAMILDDAAPSAGFLDALGRLITDESLDMAFRAFALDLPSEDDMAQTLFDRGRTPDPDRIHACREALRRAIAEAHEGVFVAMIDDLFNPKAYDPNPKDAAQRALRLRALSFAALAGKWHYAQKVFAEADNMTESIGALAVLVRSGRRAEQTNQFFLRWKDDPNTLDKWFSTLVVNAPPERAVGVAEELASMEEFKWKTPNRFRALIGGLAGNTAGFHDASGAGYRFVAEWLKKLDPINPMTAARMATVFETLARYDGDRQGQMRDALTILLSGTPSKDMQEIVGRILKI